MTTFARQERAELADLMDTVGPDAATLCGGWNTYDLAAHLVTRERRPDSALGIVLPPFAGWTERVRTGFKKRHSFGELVDIFRSGPPAMSMWAVPSLHESLNTGEFFIHHEDVRRSQPGWSPRELPEELEKALWVKLKATARIAVRKAGSGLTLVTTGGRTHVARDRTPSVTISGPPSEITLYCAGRQAVARVDATGDAELIAAMQTAPFGI